MMGLLSWIKGERRQDESDGLSLKPGRGFNFFIVDENHHQETLAGIVGGPSENGVDYETTATLTIESHAPHDSNAVSVKIDGKTVGFLHPEKAKEYLNHARSLRIDSEPVACPAKIIGGRVRSSHDEGAFSVKLSLKWPPRIQR